MQQFSVEALVGSMPLLFGLVASMLHVVSGPDHLAAVSPLAIENKLKAWVVGLGWGLGHTSGMLLVGVLFIFFRNFIPVEAISAYSESIVGLVLIAIGLWALWRVFGIPFRHHHLHPHSHHLPQGEVITHIHDHDHPADAYHSHEHRKAINQSFFSALGIGLVHGLAGFSHLMGVLPTLAFETTSQSVWYLTGFGVGTIFAMVTFSVSLGYISHATGKSRTPVLYRSIRILGALASIVVGLIWISMSF